MRRLIILTLAFALAAPLLASPVLADEGYYNHHPVRQHRIPRRPVVMIETPAVQVESRDYQACRPGWWQTIRDGRVFPQWRMYCTR